MNEENIIKDLVREKYGNIATNKQSRCCSSSCCSGESFEYTVFKDNYTNLDGYVAEADLGLGCGLPTEYAGIQPGDTVVDLGSGAGNDVFVARRQAGNSGHVVGIDMTPEMIDRAKANAAKLDYTNVEFRLGDIENLPLENDMADVVVSNCVLNLVPDKNAAFSEIYRIIKPGGRFCISDIVLKGDLPKALRESAAMYAGCVAGALQQDDYLAIVKKAGFKNVTIRKTKEIVLPDEELTPYLKPEQIAAWRRSEAGIFSITITGEK